MIIVETKYDILPVYLADIKTYERENSDIESVFIKNISDELRKQFNISDDYDVFTIHYITTHKNSDGTSLVIRVTVPNENSTEEFSLLNQMREMIPKMIASELSKGDNDE